MKGLGIDPGQGGQRVGQWGGGDWDGQGGNGKDVTREGWGGERQGGWTGRRGAGLDNKEGETGMGRRAMRRGTTGRDGEGEAGRGATGRDGEGEAGRGTTRRDGEGKWGGGNREGWRGRGGEGGQE